MPTTGTGGSSSSSFLMTRDGRPENLSQALEMVPCALQHVLAAFAGIIAPAIIIASVYNWDPQTRTDIIQVALILSAIDTGLQAFAPFRRIGGGLPIVMGVSFAFLPAFQAMGADFTFGTLLGGEIIGGIAAILFGLFYGKLRRLFPPVVTGTVIFTIGVSLYPTAIKYMAGGVGTPLWGTPQAWGVALITFAVVFGLQNFAKGTLRLGSVFFGMIAGILVSIPFGILDLSNLGTAHEIIALPAFMPHQLEFAPAVCITMAVVYPMVAIQIIGDVSAACLGSMDRMPTERELSGAVVAQGVTSVLSAFIGGLPTSALGQSVGIIASNKVVNKWVFGIVAFVFIAAGIFPPLSALLTTIPQPVIGGATAGVFGTITMNGIRMFCREGLTQRATTIVGTSAVFGLGIWMATGSLAGAGMPAWITTVIGSNAITPAALMAIVLNLILPPAEPPAQPATQITSASK